jgi:transposase InsO family protein
MKYQAIAKDVARFPVRLMCRCLEVSSAGFYAWRSRPLSPRAQANERLLTTLKVAHAQSRQTYGSPRIHAALKAEGIAVGRHRIARLMQAHGLRAKTRRKFKATTQSNHTLPVAENILNREFTVNQPNKVWVGDITYLWTQEGWLYLAVMLDLFSRKVVGFALSDRIDRTLVIQAIDQAIASRRPALGLLAHFDRGSQYASRDTQKRLADHGIVCSMSRKAECWDNACAESFFGTLKQELVYHRTYATREEAKQDIFEYIEVFYNRQRRHSTLGYMTPVEFEATIS